MAVLLLCFLLLPALFHGNDGQPLAMTYHRGTMLTGRISVNLVFYGKFTASQRAIVSDFVASFSPLPGQKDRLEPSVASWWNSLRKYYAATRTPPPRFALGRQILDESYSLGKSLDDAHLAALAARGGGARWRRAERGAHGGGRGRSAVLHEPVRIPLGGNRKRPICVHMGGERRGAVPRAVRVAVPPASVRPADAAAGGAQRRRRGRRDGDQPGEHAGGRRHQPVRRRVLPGPEGGAARGGDGVRGGVREGGVPRLPGEPAGGPSDGGQLQRAWGPREEVPGPSLVRPVIVHVFNSGVASPVPCAM